MCTHHFRLISTTLVTFLTHRNQHVQWHSIHLSQYSLDSEMFKWQPRAKCRIKSQHTVYKFWGFHTSDTKDFDLPSSKFQETPSDIPSHPRRRGTNKMVASESFKKVANFRYRSLVTRVSQLKIWHFWVIGIERHVCRCTFNWYSVITQFAKLAAGQQLCRCSTHKIIALRNL
jgi:hypothetical protein